MAKAKGQRVTFTDPGKVLFPGTGFTRAEVIAYYLEAARYLLPHFRGRPSAVKRFPRGTRAEAFWEKDLPGYAPAWLPRTLVPRKNPGEPPINYVVIDSPEVLAWLANHDTIELHPFLHRTGALDTPQFVALDLDPGECGNEGTLRAIRVALLVREFLDRLGLRSWPKVSGSKGVQLYVPLNVPVTYAATQAFARSMAELLEREHPGLVVAKMARELRAGKVFIDWSQNMPHKTTVGPYSMRAKHARPTISMPVEWDELVEAEAKRETAHLLFAPDAALQRLARRGDLWAPVLAVRQQLPDAFMKLGRDEASEPAAGDAATRVRPRKVLTRRSGQGSRRRFVIHQEETGDKILRLEIGDTLRAWRVPQLPAKSRAARRATEIAETPLALVHFEGINREAEDSPLMIWDHGTYDPVRGSHPSGTLVVFLNGTKVRGEWTLRKKGDVWTIAGSAGPVAGAKTDRSAFSGRSLQEIRSARDAFWPPQPRKAQRTRRAQTRTRA